MLIEASAGNDAKMNKTTATNANGYVASDMATTLAGKVADVETAMGKNGIIKEVKKRYVETYGDASSVKAANLKLWLLSCDEVFSDGYTTGAKGYTIAGAVEATTYGAGDTQLRYRYYEDNTISYMR